MYMNQMTSIKIINHNNILFKSKQTLQVFITTLLSLLLPLSFLLLARISTASYLLSRNLEFPVSEPASTVFFSLLSSIPFTPLHVLVSVLCVASLINALNSDGRTGFHIFGSPETSGKEQLYTAWIVLCTLQVCVGLGIEGSIGVGIEGSSFSHDRNMICRLVFFLGLHTTTVYWWRTIVKPVVDDTMFGFEMEERLVERVVMGASLGGLWWWRLRDEVEALAAVTELKREVGAGVGVVDLMSWWLYYLVVTIGIVRVMKWLVWCGLVLLYQKVEQDRGDNNGSLDVEEKV
ncbi:hypothetical protein QVD17_33804 [Tagetes erecta]|uniref:Transmembrane protein n=1 Tax=Tagetes erecta TaxID=13708 RepID=A0AAD8NLA4_TARER|nr:hypothetical protein QVD17_33804 [Tagetes erecta]